MYHFIRLYAINMHSACTPYAHFILVVLSGTCLKWKCKAITLIYYPWTFIYLQGCSQYVYLLHTTTYLYLSKNYSTFVSGYFIFWNNAQTGKKCLLYGTQNRSGKHSIKGWLVVDVKIWKFEQVYGKLVEKYFNKFN